MDNAHNSMMPEACTAQVFHLQYFLSRDFRYDLFVCIFSWWFFSHMIFSVCAHAFLRSCSKLAIETLEQ